MDDAASRALDEYLVSLSQAGSREALNRLAERWTPRLLRYAARMLGEPGRSSEAARDVVQETWLGVVRNLRRLRDPAQFPAWIYGIASRKCADAFRVEVRRRRLDADGVDRDVEPSSVVRADERIDLASAIRTLPPIQRAVIHLFYREDLSVQEIASVLGIASGTVKSRLHHARETLRQQLSARLPEHEADEPHRRTS